MPGGRPTDYSESLAKEICDTIATDTSSLKTLCANNSNWPEPRTIYVWLRKYSEFNHLYAVAKKQQITPIVDEIISISDDNSRDDKVNSNGDLSCDSEWVARSRLRVDSRKWLAAKLVPRLYGDSAGMRELYEEIAELKRELAEKGKSHGNINSEEA